MKSLRAILITLDHEQKIAQAHEVPVATNDEGDADLHDLYRLLDCHNIEVSDCDPDGPFAGHLAVLDEEGFFDNSLKGFLLCRAIGRQPYAGRVLLMRYGTDGCMAGATLALEVARKAVGNAYVSRDFARAMMQSLEDEAIAMYPGAIVVRTSLEI
jgi:hypothetical protein